MLLRAFEKHLKDFPDDKLIIIGPIETPLENLKILYKYPKSILHIGFTQCIYLYYPFFSCLVLPSFREGFGSVIIEAAACKKATISSNIPGPTDFIKNMQNGYFIKKNSLYELENALKFFSKNKNKAIKMGNNAYKLIIENFSEDEVTKKFLKEFGIY